MLKADNERTAMFVNNFYNKLLKNLKLEDFEIKLKIEGDYFDSYLYMGKLYLWTMEGSLKVINWDDLLSEDIFKDDFLLEVAFQRSDLLYGKRLESILYNILYDEDFFVCFEKKLEKLKRKIINISPVLLDKYKKFEIDISQLFPHSDIKFYKRNLYISSEKGIHRIPIGKFLKYLPKKPQKRFEKLSDVSAFSFIISYGDIYASAGDDGLIEINIMNEEWLDFSEKHENKIKERIILEKHSSYSADLYWDICSKSLISESFLIKNRVIKEENIKKTHEFDVISVKDWLGIEKETWVIAKRNKIYVWEADDIYVYNYKPETENDYDYNHENNNKFRKKIHIGKKLKQVVNSQTTAFGIIIETIDDMFIIPSLIADERNIYIYNIDNSRDVANWRVFPNSKFYENQLHLIYDDYLEVKSLLYDYFVPQKEKIIGFPLYFRK